MMLSVDEDRIIIPKSIQYAALIVLHFAHIGVNKMCPDAQFFRWTQMRAENEKKARKGSSCPTVIGIRNQGHHGSKDPFPTTEYPG